MGQIATAAYHRVELSDVKKCCFPILKIVKAATFAYLARLGPWRKLRQQQRHISEQLMVAYL